MKPTRRTAAQGRLNARHRVGMVSKRSREIRKERNKEAKRRTNGEGKMYLRQRDADPPVVCVYYTMLYVHRMVGSYVVVVHQLTLPTKGNCGKLTKVPPPNMCRKLYRLRTTSTTPEIRHRDISDFYVSVRMRISTF